jgi:putative MATE family efflux protein
MKKTDRLGEEKITKLLMSFSVPATVGMLVNALYNIIDRMYIGNSEDLGSLGLAGITISFPITLVMMAIALLFGIGGATMFSIKLGEKKPEEAEKYLGNAVTMLIGSSILYTLFSLIFLKPLMELFGTSQQVMPYAIEYMRIVLWGAVLQGLSMGLNNFIRADGSPKIAMISMFLGAVFNIIFDPIFIYVFRWGMTGAAIATVGGQLLSTIWVLLYFKGKRCSIQLKLKSMKPEFHLIRRIMETGTPSFLRQLANSLLNVVLNKGLIIYGGDIAVSGMGVINSIQTFMLMPLFGITQGAQPIIGYNYGANKVGRVKEGLKWAIQIATIISLIGWLITRIFPYALMSMFTNEVDLIAFGGKAIKIWFMWLPIVGFQVVSASYFQAVGKAKAATFLTLTRQVILLIPAVIILPKFFELEGILFAAPFADFFSAVVTGIWLWIELRHLKIKLNEGVIQDNQLSS